MSSLNPETFRPPWLDALSEAYAGRAKGVVLLTGNTNDIFWNRGMKKFLPFEQTLYLELAEKFFVVRMDVSSGLSFYDTRDKAALTLACKRIEKALDDENKIGDLNAKISACAYQPLPTLELLRALSRAVITGRNSGDREIKPMCVVVQYAGALFPAGELGQMAELDRQRTVSFLNWITDPIYRQSANLILLVSDTMAEVNGRILAEPTAGHIEIALPNEEERGFFVENAAQNAHFEMEPSAFVQETAGLRLTQIREMVDLSVKMDKAVGRGAVLTEVNRVLQAQLGSIIKVNRPEHGPEDIIGYPEVREILQNTFKRCDNPETAVSAILVSGPNGAGKSYQLEAYAAHSGRIVIELSGLRGQYFGQTERQFELLRWHIATFGKILILVDEAHTAFGSVHRSDTHETEKALAGNIIKMMGDPKFLGKVLWGLMTSRPDELDPDVKSRAPLQIPIFDPEGAARQQFVKGLFARKKIEIGESELDQVLERTQNFSARDFNFLVREVLVAQKPVPEVLNTWQASTSIIRQRRLQELIAAQHCSYPALLPERLRAIKPDAIAEEVEKLKWELYRK